MKTLVLVFIAAALTDLNAQQVGEVEDTSSEKYDFNTDSEGESLFDETFQSKYPTFSYQEDSFDDLTSRGDPLLVAPDPPIYTGPWDIHREEVSISGISALSTPHRGWPTNLPRLPNFGPIIPYPALNSRYISSEGALPSTLTSSHEVVQRSEQN